MTQLVVPTTVVIRRNSIMADGYDAFLGLNSSQLRSDIKILFKNEHDLNEAGVDHGGLFKEFLVTLIKEIFLPSQGLFLQNKEGKLYPNPTAVCIPEVFSMYQFLGRVLGKAIYEGIVVDVPFADFFLNKILGKHSVFDELQSLDAELHKNLNFIRNYEGDFEDLSLNFTTISDYDDKVIRLIPDGENKSVTNENKCEYIHLLADFKLNKQIKKQTDAFLKGFQDVVPLAWIQIFNFHELQVLISGDTMNINLEDLKANCVFEGGYTAYSSTIRDLWAVLEEFTPEQLQKFIKFVTSCPRPPMLGFKNLNPKFTITRVASDNNSDILSTISNFFTNKESSERLPTASTCFNLLKLPDYNSRSTLKKKLLLSIESNAGFELS